MSCKNRINYTMRETYIRYKMTSKNEPFKNICTDVTSSKIGNGISHIMKILSCSFKTADAEKLKYRRFVVSTSVTLPKRTKDIS